uniref:Glycosyltransferase family 92 protein n=1 Tax=Globodera rostochiensis TaxID=31243 RepID=A0A914HTJ5_GLORO
MRFLHTVNVLDPLPRKPLDFLLASAVVFFNLVFIREIEKSVANANKPTGWHNGRHHGNHEDLPITRDVIIYATFLYKNSTSFGTTGHDTFVMLMLAYRTDNFPFMRCARENIETEPVTAQLQSYDYTALCNQAIFIAICNFPTDLANDRRQNEGAMIDLGPQVLVNEQLRQTYADEPIFHELVVRKADQTPRNLLICVSRIFAFEKWQLLLTAMEVYKALGVDLVVMHIVSALSAVIKLINAYEAEGRLAVRKGFKLPILRAMNFDPELQIEYSGQLAMAHECFYEFRESAKFIALLDLDDLLVTIKFASLTDALNAASIKHSMAPYFYVNKLESGILLTRRQKNESTKASARNFMHKFRELILSKQMYNSEKLVLRPARIDAFWVHFTRDYKGKHKPVQLSNDYMTILHLSKDIKASAAEGYNEKFLTKIMNWPAAVNESDFLKKATTKKIIDQMPKKHYYFDAIRHCSRFINNYPNAPVQIPSPCLSYKLCNLPKVKVDCSVAKSKYYTKTIMPTNIYRVHVLRKSYFVKRKGGCFGRKLKF